MLKIPKMGDSGIEAECFTKELINEIDSHKYGLENQQQE